MAGIVNKQDIYSILLRNITDSNYINEKGRLTSFKASSEITVTIKNSNLFYAMYNALKGFNQKVSMVNSTTLLVDNPVEDILPSMFAFAVNITRKDAPELLNIMRCTTVVTKGKQSFMLKQKDKKHIVVARCAYEFFSPITFEAIFLPNSLN